jgi:hypothetical protein
LPVGTSAEVNFYKVKTVVAENLTTVFFDLFASKIYREVQIQVSKSMLELLNIKSEVERLSNILGKTEDCL